jgi:hypothetical protein
MDVNGMGRGPGSDAPRDVRFSFDFAGRCGCATHRASGVLGGANGIPPAWREGKRANRFIIL